MENSGGKLKLFHSPDHHLIAWMSILSFFGKFIFMTIFSTVKPGSTAIVLTVKPGSTA